MIHPGFTGGCFVRVPPSFQPLSVQPNNSIPMAHSPTPAPSALDTGGSPVSNPSD